MTLEPISPPSAQLQHLDLLSIQLSAHKAHQEARQRYQPDHGDFFFSCAGRWPSCRAGGHTRPHASTMHQPRRGMPAARVRGSSSRCARRIATTEQPSLVGCKSFACGSGDRARGPESGLSWGAAPLLCRSARLRSETALGFGPTAPPNEELGRLRFAGASRNDFTRLPKREWVKTGP